jgi:aspartate aminotransferase
MSSPRIADRATRWKPSSTLAVAAEAARRRAEGQDVIDFGPGEPDFVTPEPICAAAHEALQEGFTHYTPTPGIPELRAALAEDQNRRAGSGYEPGEVTVGCGGKQLLWEVFHTLFESGDEVLLPSPYWVSFPEQVAMSGAATVAIPTDPRQGFVPDPDAVRAACTARTRGLIVNTPSNPTGAVWPRDVLEALAELALEKNLWLISDETYDRFLYDGAEHYSLSSRPDLRDQLVIVNSFSKTYAMTGWRVGYALAPDAVSQPVQRLQSQLTSGANSVAQKAALAALRDDGGKVTESVEKMLAAFTARRSVILDGLEKVPGIECLPPRGAFYVLPDMRAAIEALGLADDAALAHHLIEGAGLALVPGQAFGAKGFLRISFAVAEESIQKGLERLASALTV